MRALLAGIVLLTSVPAAAAPRVRMFALVVGNNRSLDPKDPVLRYADDDAARFWELLGLVAEETSLLTVADARTQRLHPAIVPIAAPPTRANVAERFEALNERMRAAEEAGDKAVFYFVFSGHGGITDSRESFLHLLDGRLTRGELFRDLIAHSAASFNHLVIDACHSYFMLQPRGGDAPADVDLTGAVREYVAAESLDRYPNTGALVATSGRAETHEWGLLEAGIFSHQVRSGLTGAADVDRDGRITYAEMRAFLAAANAKVPPGPQRLATFAQPPSQDLGEPVIDLTTASGAHWLEIGAEQPGRYYLEDDRGVRWADLHTTAETGVVVLLGDRRHYWLRSPDYEVRVPVGHGPGRTLTLAQLMVPGGSARGGPGTGRGATSEMFSETLFAVPFGPSFAEGFAAGPDPSVDVVTTVEVRRQAPPVSPWVIASAGLAAALGVGAATTGVLAVSARNDYQRRFDTEGVYDEELRVSAERRSLASNVMLGAAFVAAGGAAILQLTSGGGASSTGLSPFWDGSSVGLSVVAPIH